MGFSPLKPTRTSVSSINEDVQAMGKLVELVRNQQREIEALKAQFLEMRESMACLVADNTKLHEMLAQTSAGTGAALSSPSVGSLRGEGSGATTCLPAQDSDHAVTTSTVTSESTVDPPDATGSHDAPAPTPPETAAQRMSKKALRLAPHSAADLVKHQCGDKVLRHFMRTYEGLYDVKSMSIQEIDQCQIFFFEKKVYIPAKLRAKTIEYYKTTFLSNNQSVDNALAALTKNCIWPGLDIDFYKEHQPTNVAMTNAKETTEVAATAVSSREVLDSPPQLPRRSTAASSNPKRSAADRRVAL